jgi:hypothetical protein
LDGQADAADKRIVSASAATAAVMISQALCHTWL